MVTAASLRLLIGLTLMNACMGNCPNYWISDAGSCYALIHNPTTWWDAKEECRDRKGYLVEIDSIAENNFLKTMIRTHGSHLVGVWTGGNDLLSESNWIWEETQTPFTVTDWSPGEPNNLYNGIENCLEMWKNDTFDWNDRDCYLKNAFICEMAQIEGSIVG